MSCNAKKNVEVLCEAKNCTYNDSHKCTAETIDISGTMAHESKETQCASFTEKKN